MTERIIAVPTEKSNHMLTGSAINGMIINNMPLFLDAADSYCFLLQYGHLNRKIDLIAWPQLHVLLQL